MFSFATYSKNCCYTIVTCLPAIRGVASTRAPIILINAKWNQMLLYKGFPHIIKPYTNILHVPILFMGLHVCSAPQSSESVHCA